MTIGWEYEDPESDARPPRYGGPLTEKDAAHSHAVEARQHDVEDNNLGIELHGRFKPRRSIVLAPHFEITMFQLQL